MTTNSSPPMRATVSAGRTAPRGRPPGPPRRPPPPPRPAAGPREQLVADAVAVLVVDLLEVVEVDEQHAGLAGLALGLGQRVVEAVLQERAVRQAGERVVQRVVSHPVLAAQALHGSGED